MWLNKLFIENPIDFEKRCRNRIITGVLFAVLGLAALALAVAANQIPMLLKESEQSSFVPGFYSGLGGGLIAAGTVTAIKNLRYLKNPELKKKRKVVETDERNRMLGLRVWAYAGYSMIFFLYIALLVSGFISVIVMKTLLAVLGIYGLLLLICRILLKRVM